MIFGSRQLDEKNRMIQILEDEKADLQRELETAIAANDNLKQDGIDLDKQVMELLKKVENLRDALEQQKINLA